MHFGFDDDQLAFRDAVRDLLDKECPPEVARAAADAPAGQLDRGVWDQLAAMGVPGLLVPEEVDGGLGLDERSLVLLLEEAGRAALPHPLVETAAVAAPLLPDRVAAGTIVATNLGSALVPTAADADLLLLTQPMSTTLYLVEPGAVSFAATETVDRGRRAASVRWSVADATLVSDDLAVVQASFDRGAWGTAAVLVGLAQRMLDITVAYVSERQQFGKPVGSFQAVKHHLADALKELAFARPAVWRAAHSLAVGDDSRAADVSMAKAMASDAAWFVGRQALQCHGAIGYTVEADLHLYLKRTWALAKAWGDAAWHRHRYGTELDI
jgi:alkylation response protein AidB-like acyl-CoA dehydrogenase